MSNTPKIRFKGFTDDWEQRKLGELVQITSGDAPSKFQGGDINYVKVDDLNYAYKTVVETQNKVCEHKTICKVRKGSVIFPKRGAAILTNKVRILGVDSYMDTNMMALSTNELDTEFLYILISKEGLYKIADTSTIPQINNKHIEPYEITVPKLDEQSKIGDYFRNLDNLITLHQRKCDEMKQLKKYMLQKMFPQKGEKQPRIRFKGFTDDWEQRKLEGWGTFYYGKSCPKWSVTEDATIPCIRYGELYTKFGAKIDRVYSYTNMEANNLRFSKGTEVLIPRVGEDPMDYNHCTWLSVPDVAIGEMISVFNTDNDPLFTATMFNATLQKEFAMRVEGGSVTNLYYEKLKNIEVMFPTLAEQKRIASYFELLDHLITLHQRKCDAFKELKKYMLQNMFIGER